MIDLSEFGSLVINERERQIEKEGWSYDHDDDHDEGELAKAAASYSVHHTDDNYPFPWGDHHDKRLKHPLKRRLVIAGALLWAEWDRVTRRDAKEEKQRPETTFDRQAGVPCQRCGIPMEPLLIGNAIYGYRCPKCAQEVEG